MHLAESQQTPSQAELFLYLFLKGLFDVCSSCDWHGVVQFFLHYQGELWMRRLEKMAQGAWTTLCGRLFSVAPGFGFTKRWELQCRNLGHSDKTQSLNPNTQTVIFIIRLTGGTRSLNPRV